MAEDKNLQVKIDNETDEKFNALYSEFNELTGGTKKEFVTKMISQFELEQTKIKTPVLKSDIEEIQTLTKRIDSIFIGIGERINTLQVDHEAELSNSNAGKDKTIELLQERIKVLENERNDIEDKNKLFKAEKDLAESKAAELNNQLEQLNNINAKNDTIIQEYKKNIADLTSIVSEYKEAAAENKELQKQLSELYKTEESQAQKIEQLQDAIKNHDDKLKEALAYQEEKLNFQNEKQMLELNKDFQIKADEQQSKYMKIINEYETKVKELLEKMENK